MLKLRYKLGSKTVETIENESTNSQLEFSVSSNSGETAFLCWSWTLELINLSLTFRNLSKIELTIERSGLS